MIREVSGDILLSKAAMIAHGVGPDDDFRQGLALALRERWPDLYRDFRHWCHTSHPKAGDVWLWSGLGPNGPVRIASLLTQDAPARKGEHAGRARAELVNAALRGLVGVVEKEKPTSLALPRLATGVGGLEWAVVRPLVEKHLGKLSIPVELYTRYVAGQAAVDAAVAGRA